MIKAQAMSCAAVSRRVGGLLDAHFEVVPELVELGSSGTGFSADVDLACAARTSFGSTGSGALLAARASTASASRGRSSAEVREQGVLLGVGCAARGPSPRWRGSPRGGPGRPASARCVTERRNRPRVKTLALKRWCSLNVRTVPPGAPTGSLGLEGRPVGHAGGRRDGPAARLVGAVAVDRLG